ncbi:hypothetical protein GCM10009783_07720 [Glycomyces lechevalierae]
MRRRMRPNLRADAPAPVGPEWHLQGPYGTAVPARQALIAPAPIARIARSTVSSFSPYGAT